MHAVSFSTLTSFLQNGSSVNAGAPLVRCSTGVAGEQLGDRNNREGLVLVPLDECIKNHLCASYFAATTAKRSCSFYGNFAHAQCFPRNGSRVIAAHVRRGRFAVASLRRRCNMESAKLSAVVNLQGSQLTVKTPGVFMDQENVEAETK
jgi:hypothetical protein